MLSRMLLIAALTFSFAGLSRCMAAEEKGGAAPAPAPAPPEKKDEPAKTAPAPAAPAADESKYQLIDVTSARFRLVGQKYDANSERTDEGIKPNGGTVGTFSCGGNKIELASDKFENGFIVTKEYGKIKIRFTEGMAGTLLSVFLTAEQKGQLLGRPK